MTTGWSLRVAPAARRDLKRLDPPVQRRILDALDKFVVDPRSGDIRKLNSLQWRLRIGDWRVRFSFDDEFLAEGVAASARDSQRKVEHLVALQDQLRRRVQEANKRGSAERLAADLVGHPYGDRT